MNDRHPREVTMHSRRAARRWVELVLLVCLGACGSSDAAAPDLSAQVAGLSASPNPIRLVRGQAATAFCRPVNSKGVVLTSTCDWTSADTAIVQVTTGSQTSIISARTSGETTVGVTATGTTVSATLAVTVTDTTPTGEPPPPAPACDTARAGLLFTSSFEDGAPPASRSLNVGDWDGFWIGQVGWQPWNIEKVSDPANECASSARIELRRTDPIIAGSNRAQIIVQQAGFGNGGVPVPGNRTVSGGTGDERWFGFSVYLPGDWIVETRLAPETIFEVTAGPRSPPLELAISGAEWRVQSRTGHGPQNDPSWVVSDLAAGPIARGAWTDWVLHVVWSAGPTGALEVWRDGAQVVNRVNVPTTFTDAGTFSKASWGIYKWSWNGRTSGGNSIVSSRVLFLDNVRATDGEHGSYAAVAPR